MVQIKSTKNNANSVIRNISLGVTVSMLVMVASISLLAILVSAGLMKESGSAYNVVFIHLLSVIIGCCITIAKCKEYKLYCSLFMAIAYSTVLLVMTALLFEGQYQGVAATMIVVISGSVVAAMMSKSGIKAGKGRRTRKRHC